MPSEELSDPARSRKRRPAGTRKRKPVIPEEWQGYQALSKLGDQRKIFDGESIKVADLIDQLVLWKDYRFLPSQINPGSEYALILVEAVSDGETDPKPYVTTSASESLMDDLERGHELMPYLATLRLKGRGYYRIE
jgi:hypothetical protein